MSIDSSEFNSATTNSSGNRAPPPTFSSQTFTQGQRKRPVLSNLGIEVSLASDVKTPNTPTPNLNSDTLSSDALLHIRPTPTTSSHSSQTYDNSYSPRDELKEPQLMFVFDALADFQCHYDHKSQKIDLLEKQLRHVSSQLNIRENEMQLASSERIENLNVLESHKLQLSDLSAKVKDFDKYEALIGERFHNLENLMTELTDSKKVFLKKESDLNEKLIEKEKFLQDSLRATQELRVQKASLEGQVETFDLENKEKCTEFNTKIYNLNVEIKDKTRVIDMISGEKEIILSDLKNMTSDRDRIQKECSNALKEITELAVSDPFGCDSKDLGKLDVSVSWMKSKCLELNRENLSLNLELSTFKQVINELEIRFNSCKSDLCEAQKALDDENLEKSRFNDKFSKAKQEIKDLNSQISEISCFKDEIASILQVPNDLNLFKTTIETLSKPNNSAEIESLRNEIAQLKKIHEKDMRDQMEDYGRLLREETSKWKSQKEALEEELLKLKKEKRSVQSELSQSHTNESSSKFHDADLTAIIKDLKESSGLLSAPSTSRSGNRSTTGKRPASSSLSSTSTNQKVFGGSTNNNKRRVNSTTSSSNSKLNSQKLSSPSSVNSNDIWSLFK